MQPYHGQRTHPYIRVIVTVYAAISGPNFGRLLSLSQVAQNARDQHTHTHTRARMKSCLEVSVPQSF